MTTTKIKFLLAVEDEASPDTQKSIDEDIKSLLIRLHECYIQDLLNPFKDLSKGLVSKSFDRKIKHEVVTFNQSGMI